MPLWVRTLVITGPADEVRVAVEGHHEHLRGLERQGRLRAAGRFPESGGYLEIFEAHDRIEAEAVARSSPLVEDGLGAWSLREWEEVAL